MCQKDDGEKWTNSETTQRNVNAAKLASLVSQSFISKILSNGGGKYFLREANIAGFGCGSLKVKQMAAPLDEQAQGLIAGE